MDPAPHAVDFDPALMARYDVPAPRYTSYPTAPQFHDGFGETQLREAVETSNTDAPRPLSLYVHVPFCWSPCFYCGCTRVITRDPRKADRYLEYLRREIAMIAPLFSSRRRVRQLHFGGGTPNFLDIARLGALVRDLAGQFRFAGDKGGVEAGIEVDPRFADHDYVCNLGAQGFNRISVGVQDFDPAVQAAVNRVQPAERIFEVVAAARAADFHSVNIDLIYGLPKQTVQSFGRTLDRVIELAPDRIAVYGYAHLPRLYKAQRQIDAGDLPDPAARLRLLGLALDKLCGAGYVYVGMDHFARHGDELVQAQRQGTLQRNFQGYSTRGECDIVGLGMSAIGRIGDSYSQNARDLPGYYMALDNRRLPVARGIVLDADDRIRRAAINEVMCHASLDMQAFGERHGIRFADYFFAELQRLRQLEADGLVDLDPRMLRATPRGRLLIRNVAMCFDAYLDDEAQVPQPRYARSI
jgi:oxygen-independent coproporphyrinogen-3 oxidase